MIAIGRPEGRAGSADAALVILGLATLLLAIHATADSLVAPEPGTSWDDHVRRWLTSIAVLLTRALIARLLGATPYAERGAAAAPARHEQPA